MRAPTWSELRVVVSPDRSRRTIRVAAPPESRGKRVHAERSDQAVRDQGRRPRARRRGRDAFDHDRRGRRALRKLGEGLRHRHGGEGQGHQDRGRRGARRHRIQVRGPGPAARVRGSVRDRAGHRSRSAARGDREQHGLHLAVQAQGRPHPRLGTRDLDASRRRRRQGHGRPQDQGRPARRHRRAGLPARIAGRHAPHRRHRRVHRSRDRGQDPQDRRSAHEHRHLAPQADRRAASGSQRTTCCPTLRSVRSARVSSRTSPTSARSSTSAASTACCTSRT
jgi:hypothetical protein